MSGRKRVTFYEEGENHRCVSKGGPTVIGRRSSIHCDKREEKVGTGVNMTKRIEYSCLGQWGYFSVARDFCRGLVNMEASASELQVSQPNSSSPNRVNVSSSRIRSYE